MKPKFSNVLISVLIIAVVIFACQKLEIQKIMVIKTKSVNEITGTTATVKGEVIDLGEGMTDYGVFYSTTANAKNGDKVSAGIPNGTGEFTVPLRGLTLGTKYYTRAYGSMNNTFVYGDEINFTTLGLPTITTSAITNITATTASSGGIIIADGGAPVTARGICWSTSTSPSTDLTSKTNDGNGIGGFTSTINGLTDNTTYFVRAFAINSVGISYGNELSFKSNQIVISLTTTAITSITATNAIGGGNIISDGGAVVTARGICWSTSPSPINSLTTKTTNGNGTGSFASNIIGLTANTTYYVRAYATNLAGTFYGSEQSFKTLDGIPVLTTTVTSKITTTTALSGGNILSDGGSSIIARGVVWSINQNPTIALDTKTIDGSGLGSFTSNISGLTPNTSYYIRAYATNNLITVYAQEVSFKTGEEGIGIGKWYAGGIVFYIDETGQHGLVCAPNDLYGVGYWGCWGTLILGADGRSIGTGMQNTIDIVNGCNSENCAARACYNLVINGYSDWFLPSIDELKLMYLNLKVNGLGDFINTLYWSSSEYDARQAWSLSFSDGSQNSNYNKENNWLDVRAIRAF